MASHIMSFCILFSKILKSLFHKLSIICKINKKTYFSYIIYSSNRKICLLMLAQASLSHWRTAWRFNKPIKSVNHIIMDSWFFFSDQWWPWATFTSYWNSVAFTRSPLLCIQVARRSSGLPEGTHHSLRSCAWLRLTLQTSLSRIYLLI